MGLETLWVGLGDSEWSQGACWVMLGHGGWGLERLSEAIMSGGWGLEDLVGGAWGCWVQPRVWWVGLKT